MNKFILELPAWDSENYFTSDIILFVLLWAALAVSILLCFWGYKYMQTLVLVILGCACGVGGILIAEHMTENAVLKLCFFVMFLFFGVCMLYLISILLGKLLCGLHVRDALYRQMYLVSALVGGGFIGALIYFRIYRELWVAALVGLFFAVTGAVYGKKKAAERKPFYTYEDLCRLQPLEEGEDHA